jgi:hypothetical protein
MRALFILFACFALVCFGGCDSASTSDDGGAADAGPPDAGPTCTVLEYTRGSGALSRWPEPSLAVADATTETGVRLHVDEATYGDLLGRLRGYRQVFTDDLSELDGFGINAEAFFMFGRAFDPAMLPTSEDTASPGAGLGFVVLGPTPELRPVLVDTTDATQTILMAPMRPLPARATVAAYVTRALTGAAGDCLEPSEDMAAEIAAPESADAIAALVSLGVIASADDLVGLTVFSTQSIEEDTLAVAADIRGRDAPTFMEAPTCTTEALWVRCEARFEAGDYRDADGVFRRDGGAAASPVTTYEIPVTFWLPLTGTAPYPTMMYGHGLSGDRTQAQRLAEFAAPLGIATVAAPALMHGEHPTNPDPSAGALNIVLSFFAIGDLSSRALNATALREHFRQTTWDRLQLTRLLQQAPDVDGDGAPDVDADRLSYLGVSLGGLMGPELIAATDAFGAGVLVVPGGRVSTIMSDSSLFGSLVDLLRPRNVTEGDVRRFWPVLQTVLDAGDPASYGAHTLTDRFASAPRVPDLLVGVVLDDQVVPNLANYSLGRALGVPMVAPVRRPEIGFDVVTGPVSGNFAGGAATAGLVQFDFVRNDAGEVVAATHDNVGDSDVGAAAWLDFLTSHLDGATQIRDPYEAIAFPRP